MENTLNEILGVKY